MAENKPKQKEEVKVTSGEASDMEQEAPDFAEVIGRNVAPVMRNSRHMDQMNASIDAYLATLTPEEKSSPEFKEKLKKQLVLGRQAMEAALQRIFMSIG